ncbi:reverse transcriptase domain-containing protein [Tanacetum coccineum]|uniref:Reverse transcriptase domain-containing protein n=1 Tax=Tanacetum coccineum TaxID=301880 RepID=A0ABQ5DRR2_9ASTR
MAHEMIKFSVNGGIVTIRNTILTLTESTAIAATPKDTEKKAETRHTNFKVAIHLDFTDQEIAIGGALSAKEQTELYVLLKANLDISVWQPSDMTGVPRSIAKHRLNICDGYPPVRQKNMGQAPKRAKMAEADEEKTAFHTPQGVYCYTKMPFSLKNSGATYQRLVDKAFDKQVGQNLEVYVDDLVIKKEGKFLGYMIGPEGIKLCPDKVDPVLQLPSPRTINEVQSLNEKLADLNRFLSKSAEKSLLLFKTLKKCTKKATSIGPQKRSQIQDDFLVEKPDEVPINISVKEEDNMIKYLEKIKSLVGGFDNFSISQVPRSKNKKADALSKIASTSFAHLSKQVLDEILKEKSIQEKEVAAVVEEEGPTWMTPILEYLKDGTLPDDRKKASKLCIKARQYELWEGILYRRSFLNPWLRAAICGGQGHAVWILLAKHASRCTGYDMANRSLGEGIKARLGEGNKNWLEELPHVFWAHRTMIKSSNDDTLFSLTYGTEAVILVEIGMPTYRIAVVDAVHNDEELRLNLDLLEKRRERAEIREAKAKLNMKKYYNARVRGFTFRPGDFFYRCNDASHAVDGGKLGLKWEGPYEVIESLGDGAYKLRSTDGTILPRTWNIANLKKCYL